MCWFAHDKLYVPYKTMVERMVGLTSSSNNVHEVVDENSNSYTNIVMDVMRLNQGYDSQCPIVDDEPNTDAARFFDLLKDSDELLWDGCTNQSELSVIVQVFTINSYHRLSEASYNRIVEWAKSILLEENRLKENFYVVKFMKKPLGLRYQKIDMCLNFYMLSTLKI